MTSTLSSTSGIKPKCKADLAPFSVKCRWAARNVPIRKKLPSFRISPEPEQPSHQQISRSGLQLPFDLLWTFTKPQRIPKRRQSQVLQNTNCSINGKRMKMIWSSNLQENIWDLDSMSRHVPSGRTRLHAVVVLFASQFRICLYTYMHRYA